MRPHPDKAPLPYYSPRFENAFLDAHRCHGHHKRKGKEVAYLSHLMTVAALVMEHGGNEDEVIAGLLHDIVEDCGGKPRVAEIEREYGPAVAAIVVGCTDADTEPKPPWRERKERYIAHVRTASPSVRLVSACDKLANARDLRADYHVIGDMLWDRFNGGRDGTLWYYRSLVDAYRSHGESPLVAELHRTVEDLAELSGLARR
ncbi:MAG: guanosine polyphosphate pyrophosphohydrolase [Planctomycetota bacterium]